MFRVGISHVSHTHAVWMRLSLPQVPALQAVTTGEAVSLQLRVAIGTTSTELFVLKDGDGSQGDVVLLPRKSIGKQWRDSMEASWLVRDWTPSSEVCTRALPTIT